MKADGVKTAPDGPYEERFVDGTLAAEGFEVGRACRRWPPAQGKTANNGAANCAMDNDGEMKIWSLWVDFAVSIDCQGFP